MDGAENCVPSHVNHLNCRDDCLIIYFSRIKKNQYVVGQIIPWYMQYNPDNPVVFPVNSLAVYIFLYTHKLMGDRKLFPCSAQYNRYTKMISDITKEHKCDLSSYEKVENLGLHSVKNVSEFFCYLG